MDHPTGPRVLVRKDEAFFFNMGNHGHVKQWLNQLEQKPLLRDAMIAGGWVVVGAVLLSFGITPLWDDVAVVAVASWAFTFTLIPMAAVTLLRSRHPIIALVLDRKSHTSELQSRFDLVC